MSTNINGNTQANFESPSAGCIINPLLDKMMMSLDTPVIICDGSLRIERLNSAASRLLAQHGERADGKRLADLPLFSISSGNFLNWAGNVRQASENFSESVFHIGGEVYSASATVFAGHIIFMLKSTSAQPLQSPSRNFKILFENMASPFMYFKSMTSSDGVSVSYQIIDVNSSFEIEFGVERHDAVGRNICDVLRDVDDEMLSVLYKSAKYGSPLFCQYYLKSANKHFDVRIFSPIKGYSAAVFNDIKYEMEYRNNLIIKNEVSKAFAMGGNGDVYKVVLDLVLRYSQSKSGFIGCVEDNVVTCLARKDVNIPVTIDRHGNEVFVLQPNMPACQALESRSQVMQKNYMGYKEVMVTPVISDDDDKVVGFVGAADSVSGFTLKSRTEVKGLADYISPLMLSELKDRKYRQELKEARDQAEAGERLKANILKNLSHELRTPLNSIMGFSELLYMDKGNLIETHHNFVSAILTSSKELKNMVDMLTILSKIESNCIDVNLTKVNINSQLVETCRDLRKSAEQRNIGLELYTPLPDSESNVMTDFSKFSKIISILVSNGIKFTEHGGVTFGYTVDGDNFTFYVEDTGIGILPSKHHEIFLPFMQGDNSLERKYNGPGLGLTICKSFVDALGGKIWFNSVPQSGTTFYVKFKFKRL